MLAHIAERRARAGIDAHAYRWVRRDADPVDSGALSVSWEASVLPAGFRMTASARQMLPAARSSTWCSAMDWRRCRYSSRSAASGAPSRAAKMPPTLGASSAYSTVVQGYRVTAVGEVPPETVRVIAQSIRTAGPAPSMPNRFEACACRAPRRVNPWRSSIFDGPSATRSVGAARVEPPTSPRRAASATTGRPFWQPGAAGGPGAPPSVSGPGAGPGGTEHAPIARRAHVADAADARRLRPVRGNAHELRALRARACRCRHPAWSTSTRIPKLQRRYGLKIPVLLLDSIPVCSHRLDAAELLRLLQRPGLEAIIRAPRPWGIQVP